jgi:hypothetical protein
MANYGIDPLSWLPDRSRECGAGFVTKEEISPM